MLHREYWRWIYTTTQNNNIVKSPINFIGIQIAYITHWEGNFDVVFRQHAPQYGGCRLLALDKPSLLGDNMRNKNCLIYSKL